MAAAVDRAHGPAGDIGLLPPGEMDLLPPIDQKVVRVIRERRGRCGNFVRDYIPLTLAGMLTLYFAAHTYLNNNAFYRSIPLKVSPFLAKFNFIKDVFEVGLITELVMQHFSHPLRLLPDEGISRRVYQWCQYPENQLKVYKAAFITGLFMLAASENSLAQTTATALLAVGFFHVAYEKWA